MRKIFVTAFSIVYMVIGLWSFANSLIPNSLSRSFIVWRTEHMVINLSSLVGGFLAFYAGMSMLRLNEFGRKFVIILLSIRVATNIFGIVWLLSLKNIAGSVVTYQGEQIYRVNNPYSFPSFLLIWSIFVLLIIRFLTQSKTKKLFTPEIIDTVEPENLI